MDKIDDLRDQFCDEEAEKTITKPSAPKTTESTPKIDTENPLNKMMARVYLDRHNKIRNLSQFCMIEPIEEIDPSS
jgi:hypothetical protein